MKAEYDAERARRGLIVPVMVEHLQPDDTDLDGYYDMVDVEDMTSMYARQVRGQWHGRVIRTTVLEWRWRDDVGDPLKSRQNRRGFSFRDLFRRPR